MIAEDSVLGKTGGIPILSEEVIISVELADTWFVSIRRELDKLGCSEMLSGRGSFPPSKFGLWSLRVDPLARSQRELNTIVSELMPMGGTFPKIRIATSSQEAMFPSIKKLVFTGRTSRLIHRSRLFHSEYYVSRPFIVEVRCEPLTKL